jgi:succinoglycan biosynthesis protein ExoM
MPISRNTNAFTSVPSPGLRGKSSAAMDRNQSRKASARKGNVDIAVCVATLNRPKLLANLLRGLCELRFDRIAEPSIRVVVVDNDPVGSAEFVVRANMTRWPVVYCVEPRRGIAQARNRGLDHAGDAEFVAFIDDDERPDPDWLEELLIMQAQLNADVTAGPVFPHFLEGVPAWVIHGGFFDPVRHSDGEVITWCATNNALVRRNVFEKVARFDEQFELSGADDLHFFVRVFEAGLTIVWATGAIVRETVAPDRANVHWLLRRAYRGGNCYALVEGVLDERAITRGKRILKACFRIAQGILGAGLGLFRGQIQLIYALRHVCLGYGMLVGLVGVRDQSYRTVTGM